MVRCVGCGMVYLQNPPDQSALEAEFAWEKTKPAERARRRAGRSVRYAVSDALKGLNRAVRRGRRKELQLLRKFRPRGGRLLDIGCAHGAALEALLPDGGWEPYGIEPSPGLAAVSDAVCRRRGGRVVRGTALAGLEHFESDFFDAVLMWSFLEHEIHVGEVLAQAARVLAAGGCAVLKVPNVRCWNARLTGRNWPGVRHPDHVNYFDPANLRRALLESGFSRVAFPLYHRLSTDDNMCCVAVKG